MSDKSPLVLLVNGSPHPHGCTAVALEEVALTLEKEGLRTRMMHIGQKDIRGCVACGQCGSLGHCVFDDAVREASAILEEAAGMVVGSPVYYGSPNATLLAFLDRLFYSKSFDTTMKVGASVVSCRRSGNTASFDVLNKYFTISGMPLVSSRYWNNIHGFTAEDARKDLEGLQTMRILGRNMAFLIRSIELGRSQFGLPEAEKEKYFTSFPDGL